MTANPPMLKRFAGNEPVTNTLDDCFEAGLPCAQTQFMVIEGMAVKPDGKLVVSDEVGGAVVEITHPGGPNCQSHYVAGTHAKFLDTAIDYSNFGTANPGDVDGKGADAKFWGVGRLAVDANNNIFVYDEGNSNDPDDRQRREPHRVDRGQAAVRRQGLVPRLPEQQGLRRRQRRLQRQAVGDRRSAGAVQRRDSDGERDPDFSPRMVVFPRSARRSRRSSSRWFRTARR